MNMPRFGLACVVTWSSLACGGESGARIAAGAGGPSTECSPDAVGFEAAFAGLDSLIAARRESGEIPGLAAGVVCRDTLVWAGGYGVMALDDPRPVGAGTVFRIASLTKLFTATAVMQLEQSGALAIEDPVARHLPWFEIERPASTGTDTIRIWHLLTHASGLPRDSRLTDFGRLFQPTRDDAIAALPSQALQAAPGEEVAYSNLGYAVLGEVIRAVSGLPYESYLQDRIFAPLGMAATLAHPDRADDTAWGHGPIRPDAPRQKAGFWDLRFATPAGGMASSVEDLSRFVILQLTPYAGTESGVLSSTSIQAMHELQMVVDSTRSGMGLGWGLEFSAGQNLVYHGGELPEQTSFVLLDLNALIGVVVLTNAQDVDANGLAQDALRIVRVAVLDSTVVIPEQAIPR